MKKVIYLILAVIIAVASFYTVTAEETVKEYYIEAANATVYIPEEFICIDRDAKEDDEFYQKYSISYDFYQRYMISNNVYLSGLNEGPTIEIGISVLDSQIRDLEDLDQELMPVYTESLAERYKEKGAVEVSVELYQPNDIKIMKTKYAMASGSVMQYVVEYSIIHEYKAINIRLFSYAGWFTEEQAEIIDAIAGTIKFDK